MRIGLEVLEMSPKLAKDWQRCALVSNQASVNRDFRPAWVILKNILGNRLTTLFGPQHGFESTVQDNMIETNHGVHQPTGLPVYSLYSETREPTEEMLKDVDTIVVDLQHIGSRVYTFKYTLAGCLRAAKKYKRRVVVLDRPNLLGGEVVDGPVLHPEVRSFVGEFPIPMRHGLSMGEVARFFNREINAELHVVELMDWKFNVLGNAWDRPWVLTSPNMPFFDAAFTFPGTVLLEATNLSEGRGTCLPFLFIGAPYIASAEEYVASLYRIFPALRESGMYLRPTSFQPSFQKWAQHVCNGLQIHIQHYNPSFSTFKLGLATIRAALECGGKKFAWKQPPYEYEYHKLPIDLICGFKNASNDFESDRFDINASCWTTGQQAYIQQVQGALIYPRQLRTASSS